MDHPQTIKKNVDINSRATVLDRPGSLLVYEIFETVQGEMPFAGYPAIFIRLGGCNRGDKMSCPGCDTAFFEDKSTRMSYDELSSWLSKTEMANPLIVITGGEPGVQKSAVLGFIEYLDYTLWRGPKATTRVQIETNGDFDFLRVLEHARNLHSIELHIVVSPKRPVKAKPWYVRAYGLPKNVYIRTVVVADPKSAYHKIPVSLNNCQEWVREKIYLSGQTVYHEDGSINHEATRENVAYAVKYASTSGYRVSFQSHVFLGIR